MVLGSYKSNSQRQQRSNPTPKDDQLDFSFFDALKGTHGENELIQITLKEYSHLTRTAILQTLKALAASYETAHIALNAGKIYNRISVVRAAAAILVTRDPKRKDELAPYLLA